MWQRLTSQIAEGSMTMEWPPWPHSVQDCRSTQHIAASSLATSPCLPWLRTALYWWKCMWATRTNLQMEHWKRYAFRATMKDPRLLFHYTTLVVWCEEMYHCNFVLSLSCLLCPQLGERCSELKDIHLGQCYGITDEGMVALARGCPKLQRLYLQENKMVSSSLIFSY